MKTFCNFTVYGKEQLGSDAWFRLDGRNSLEVQKNDCRKRMKILKSIKPNYNGFRIIVCENLRGTKEKIVYTEQGEL